MPLMMLLPRQKDSNDWKLSTWRHVVIVRASDEAEARALTTREFAVAARKIPRP